MPVHWPIPLSTTPKIVAIGVGPRRGPGRVLRGPNESWCFHLHHTAMEIEINGQAFLVPPGGVTIMPPKAEFVTDVHEHDVHFYAHLRFDAHNPPEATIPLVQALDNEWDEYTRTFRHAISRFHAQPARSEACLWEMLWQLCERSSVASPASTRIHPALQQAIDLIELRLHDPLSVGSIADAVYLSHNHLTRLFQNAFGVTTIAYIRKRRMERAEYLLTRTNQPIKDIADQVGIDDLHLFNKTVHQVFGCSPREMRHRAADSGERV